MMAKVKASARERRIIALAQKINRLMRAHAGSADSEATRNEAIDAHEAARILFRLPKDEYASDER